MKELIASMLPSGLHCKAFLRRIDLQKGLLICFLSFFAAIAGAQETITVKGSIVNQDGEGLPGVSVQVKGTSKGTTSKTDGSFQIDAPSNSTLVISYVGYVSQAIKAASD